MTVLHDPRESTVTTFDTPGPIRARIRLHSGGVRVVASGTDHTW